MATKPLTVAGFMSSKQLSLTNVFNLLKRDFVKDGKDKNHLFAQTTFYDAPPTGMGYNGDMGMQIFLDYFVNDPVRGADYNLAPGTRILVTYVLPQRTIYYLTILIHNHQR